MGESQIFEPSHGEGSHCDHDSQAGSDDVRVKLLNFANSKIIRARVLSSHEVRVDMEGTP